MNKEQRNRYKRQNNVAVIAFVIWISSILLLIALSLLFLQSSNANGGIYTPMQNLLLILTIFTGGTSFLVFCATVCLRLLKKPKILVIPTVIIVYILVQHLVNQFNSQGLCRRIKSYDLHPEFQRAISLLIQRYSNSPHIKEEDKSIYKNMQNCVYLEYRDFKGAREDQEAWFLPLESNNNKLVIQVDETYSQMDDLSIAFVLSHELTHAKQFLQKSTVDNINSEIEAYKNQLIFASQLNTEELISLEQRLSAGSQNTQIQILNELWKASSISIRSCGIKVLNNISKNDLNCFSSELDKNIRKLVIQAGYK